MERKDPTANRSEFEKAVLDYIKQANSKLDKEFAGTREAIRQIAVEKVREFIAYNDIGIKREERKFLELLIITSMFQSFSYGYSIGKIEGKTSKSIYL